MKNINDLLAEVSKKDKFTDNQLIAIEKRKKLISYEEAKKIFDDGVENRITFNLLRRKYKTSYETLKTTFKFYNLKYPEDIRKEAYVNNGAKFVKNHSRTGFIARDNTRSMDEKRSDIKSGMTLSEYCEKWLKDYSNRDSCRVAYYRHKKKYLTK